MEAPEDLRVLARNGLREIAARELEARGRGRTAVFYPAGHRGSFAGDRWRRFGRSPSRSGCWYSTGGTKVTLGEPRPAGAAGEDVLGAGAAVHHVRGLREDRAGDGYRGGAG